jgi:hypothetical protein
LPVACEANMIHIMKTATIRQLRTQFPRIGRMLDQEGQLLVTDLGRRVILLQPYRERVVPHSARLDCESAPKVDPARAEVYR